MSDIEKIFYVLTAFSLLFAMVWIRPGGVLFISHLGERHRLRWLSGRAILQNGRGGLLLGNLFPMGSSFVAAPWPFAISPTGVLAYSLTAPTPDGRPDSSGEFISFAEMRSTNADGKTLLINGRPFLTLQSKTSAVHWARALTELQALSEAERGPWIGRALSASCDSAAATRIYADCRRNTLLLRGASTILFLYCFLALGLATFAEWLIPLLQALLGYAILMLIVFLLHRRAERKTALAGDSSSGHGWMILISPVDAFRAADHLFRQPLEIYHPFALCGAVVSRDTGDDFARRVARDMRYPLPQPEPFADGRADETARWFSERLRNAIDGIFRDQGLDANKFLVAPQPDDEEVVAYCPRCEGQFVRGSGTCSACDVAVEPFTQK